MQPLVPPYPWLIEIEGGACIRGVAIELGAKFISGVTPVKSVELYSTRPEVCVGGGGWMEEG